MKHLLLLIAIPLAAADPCAVLPEAQVRQIFELLDGVPVRTVRADGCSYLWKGLPPTGPQLREALMSGKRVPPRPDESVSIRVETPADSRKELEARYSLLEKGYTVERDGRSLTVKPQQVARTPAVGDVAFWNGTLHQLVLVDGPELISIVVKKGLDDADLRRLAETAGQAAVRNRATQRPARKQ